MVDTERPAIEGTDEFLALREFLAGERSELPASAPDGHRRLFDAVGGLACGVSGNLDVCGLVRQALRREEHRSGRAPTLRVPTSDRWPVREAWSQVSCDAWPDRPGWLRVRAAPWKPEWLPTIGAGFDDVAAAAGTGPARRRVDHPLEADPFFTAALGAGYTHYRSAGQAQAARAAMALPAGGTLIVNLPTGSGKTEVALAPAVVRARRGGTSLLVVPTVSLAQDLERRLGPILSAAGYRGPIAFLRNTADADRSTVIRAVRQGQVPIVVTSPESAQLTGLRDALIAAAQEGLVRYLALDEAHLVRAWGGGDFRPHFQSLASLRDRLLEESAGRGEALRTLLLSATLGAADIDLLSGLFGLPGPLQLTAANAQRPEPDYWSAQAPDTTVRQAWVLEAIARLPKPLLLYLTRPEHANEWVQHLQARGLLRVTSVTGASKAEDRIGALLGLRSDEGATTYDVVVATAAFGLGVSYDDIRSVIHACLPESIDRFYQEIGRGGRDGNASISLVVWTDADRQIQGNLANRIVIRPKKARDRWNAMWNNRRPADDGYSLVDLDDYPAYLREESSYNHAWNLATLSLMRQVGFIDVRTPPDRSTQPNDNTDQAWTRSLEVRLLSGGLRDEDPWAKAWRQLRADVRSGREAQLDAMRQALNPTARICDLLAGAYRPHDDHGFGWAQASLLTPQPLCGRCMACRPRPREEAPAPTPPPPRQTDLSFGAALLRLLGNKRALVALANRPTDPRTAGDFLAATIGQGAAMVLLPENLRHAPPVRNACVIAPLGYVFIGTPADRLESLPPVPTVAVTGNPLLPAGWFLPRTQPLVVLAPPTATNPFDPQWALTDVAPSGIQVLSLDELVEALR